MRTTVKITTAIAALLIVTPARACTDWKEVAAPDAIIAADDRENFRNAEALTSKCGSSTPKRVRFHRQNGLRSTTDHVRAHGRC
jgi:hypothetical protein